MFLTFVVGNFGALGHISSRISFDCVCACVGVGLVCLGWLFSLGLLLWGVSVWGGREVSWGFLGSA